MDQYKPIVESLCTGIPVKIEDDKSSIIKVENVELNALSPQPSTSKQERKKIQSNLSISLSPTDSFTVLFNYATVQKASSSTTGHKIDNALTYFIATNMMPYSLVENEGFKLFLNALNPSYKLPDRKTLSKILIPSMYNDTCTIIGNIIGSANFFSFTTYCWTSSSNQPFICFTCHFINADFKLSSACLGCIELSQEQDNTGKNIADAIQMLISDYEIPDWKICSIVTDESKVKMVLDAFGLNISYVPCFGHALNTAVLHIFNMGGVKDLIEKVKLIHNLFAHDWKAVQEMGTILERLNLPYIKFPSYSKTPWLVLELINVIIEQDHGLTIFLKAYESGKHKKLSLYRSDIVVLKNLSNILQLIREITDNLAGYSYVTCSAILPAISSLKSKLSEIIKVNESEDIGTKEQQIKNMFNTIIEILDQHYQHNEMLIICTVLDPRFKTKSFKDINLTVLKGNVVEFCETTYKSTENDGHVNNSYNQLQLQKKKKTGLSVIFCTPENHNIDNVQEVPLSQKVKRELDLYLNNPLIELEQDPLDWWNMNKTTYPIMFVSAKKAMTVQATCVAPENSFSKDGCILTDQISSLTNEHASELIFLTMNKDYIPKPAL